MLLQGVESVFDLKWNNTLTWGDVYRQNEIEFSEYNFSAADTRLLVSLFNQYEAEAVRLFEKGLPLPGYDYTIKCSHIFNVLEARGAISISERVKMIARVRALASQVAQLYRQKISEQSVLKKGVKR